MVVVTLLTIIRSGRRVAMVMLSKTLDLRDNVTCQVMIAKNQDVVTITTLVFVKISLNTGYMSWDSEKLNEPLKKKLFAPGVHACGPHQVLHSRHQEACSWNSSW